MERENAPSRLGLDFCNRLFALEQEYEDLSAVEHYRERLARSRPIFEAFYAWAKSVNALPKSAYGKALHYALEQRTYLEKVFLDGQLELSNNRAERSIKPFVIGRKNWLFSATAKENLLNPFAYLQHIIRNHAERRAGGIRHPGTPSSIAGVPGCRGLILHMGQGPAGLPLTRMHPPARR